MSQPDISGTIPDTAATPAGPVARGDWLQQRWLWVLLCIAAALPLIYPTLPALNDLGGHLGRYAVQVDGGRSADLRQWYSFHWDLIPNIGVDLLMQALAPQMGLEPALKAIVMAIPVLQVAGYLWLSRVVHGRVTPLTLFALPLAYGYPFLYGFVNFTLSAALATCALALWIRMDDCGQTGRRWLIFVPISCLLWVCHLVGWGLLGIFATAVTFTQARARAVSIGQLITQTALPLTCLAAPVVLKWLFWHAAGAPSETNEFFHIGAKLNFIVMPLRDRSFLWDAGSALFLLAMIGWSWRSSGFERHRGLALGAVWLGITFLVMPGKVFGSSNADMRLVPMLLASALIAVRPAAGASRRLSGWLAVAGLAFTGARLASTAASFAYFDRQFSNDLAVLNTIPRGVTLISLAVEPCDQTFLPWQIARRSHLGGYAIARRHDFSNDQWVIPGGQLLAVHNRAAGEFAIDPSQLAHRQECRDDRTVQVRAALVPRAMQYLWVLDDGVVRPIAGWHPVARSSGSVVYASR